MSRDDVIRGLQEKFRQAGQSLNELERRHWAANEALTLGRGGISVVSAALRMSPNTIRRGIQELRVGHSDGGRGQDSRIRKSGGGRKSKIASSGDASREVSRPTRRGQ